MPLPNVVVIGAMKCGTTALNAHLDKHPQVAMSVRKELNFFFGPDRPPAGDTGDPDDPGVLDAWWRHGQWHRGLDWYAAQFDAAAPLRGESSPGYTAPGRPEVAVRMCRTVPDVRLVYLVRDPVARAVSQWEHHRREGSEQRPLEAALLDPASQYVARSRYLERLHPFLEVFPHEQLLVVVQERLARDPRGELRRVFEHLGADPGFWDDAMAAPVHQEGTGADVADELRAAFWDRVRDDVRSLRELLGDPLPEWREPE